MKYKILRGFVKNKKGELAEAGKTIDITDKKLASALLRRGNILEVKGK